MTARKSSSICNVRYVAPVIGPPLERRHQRRTDRKNTKRKTRLIDGKRWALQVFKRFVGQCSNKGWPNPSHGYTYLVRTNNHQQQAAQRHHQLLKCKSSQAGTVIPCNESHHTERGGNSTRYTINATLPGSISAAHGPKPGTPRISCPNYLCTPPHGTVLGHPYRCVL